MSAHHKKRFGAFLAILSVALVAGTTGCGSGVAPMLPVQGQDFGGQAFGGGQPVANATIQLYTPGTTGYGSASTPLLTRSVVSDSSGNFSIKGAFTCPSASSPVYLVAAGGNPGLNPGTYNSALALMTLIGQCGDLQPGSFFNVNELTTVAAVWSLAPFMLDYAHVGTSPGNVQGLLNGFATAQALVNVHTGKSPGSTVSVMNVPSTEINTLAAILSSCVNTNGSTSLTAACGRLFSASAPPGSTTPADTIAAAIDIARNPSHNVGSLFSNVQPNGPFQPTMSSAPPDWTIAITYIAPQFQSPADLTVDSQGNAWVLSNAGASSSVSIVNVGGISATFPQTGSKFARMALDSYDDLWLSNSVSSNVVELNSAGVRATLNPFSGAGIQGPGVLAFDGTGNVWVANNSATVSKLSANGAPLSPASTGFSTGGTGAPTGLALDYYGNLWIADSAGSQIIVLSSSGTPIPGSPYTGAGISGPFAIGIDSTGGAWVANRIGSSLSRLTSYGTAVAGSPYYGGGLNAPIDLGLDGLGNVWLVNSGSNSVSEFLSTGKAQSGATGYGSASLYNPFKLGIDRSGNVWVANLGTATAGSGTITEIVGVAAPAVTPLSLAVQNGTLNQRP